MKVNDAGFLHEHNMEAYVRVTEMLKEALSCAVVQPTGTGKSHIMMKLLDDYRDDWKIVIAPSRDFLNNLESKEAWTSNKTITLTYTLIGLRSDDIDNLLTEYLVNPELVKLIIIDEMHRAGAPKWGAGINKLIETCKNAKIVGLTATPKRYSEKRDMVDELFNGRLAQNMNLSEAINRGIIPKLSYVVGMHNIRYDLNRLLREFTDESGRNYMSRLVKKYEEKWDFDNYFSSTLTKYLNTNEKSGKHIIFASSIAEAERMYPEIEKWFSQIYKDSTIKVYNIHSKSSTKSSDTEEFFEPNDEFEIKVAIAVNMLNESFHSDEIKSISMFRGTQSLQVYMQQIGRALVANGNAPFIFDFVDNYNSLTQLSNELKNTTFRGTDGKLIKSDSIFDKFFDETDWFIKDIEEFKMLNNYSSIRPYKHMMDVLNELECSGIFEAEDKDKEFFNWSIYMLSHMHYRNFRNSSEEFESNLYNKYGILSNILNALGYKWYKQFIKWSENNNNLDESQIRILKSDFCKAVILKQLDIKTLDWLKDKGLATKIYLNKKALLNLLDKYKCTNFKYREKLLDIENIAKDDNRYTFYRTFELIEENVDSMNRASFLPKDFGDALVFWLYRIYKNEYREDLTKLQNIFNEYNNVVLYSREIKKSRTYISDIDLVNYMDKYLVDTTDYCDIQKPAVEILKHYGIKTYESFKNSVIRTLSLVDSKKYIEKKLIAYAGKQISLENLFEFIEDNKRQVDNKIKLDKYTWSNYVMELYNEINKYTEDILKLKNEEADEWIHNEILKLSNEIVYHKAKKSNSTLSGAVNCKYNNLLENYKDARLIVDDITDEYKDEYLKNVELATDKWREVYGEDSIVENQFAIGLFAITMCSFSRKIMVGKSITTKLANNISLFLEWLPDSEKLLIGKYPNNLESTIKLVEIVKEDLYYLISITMTKKTRKNFVLLYETYKSNGKILHSKNTEMFEGLSSKDSILLHVLDVSKTVDKFTDLKDFCDKLNEDYEEV